MKLWAAISIGVPLLKHHLGHSKILRDMEPLIFSVLASKQELFQLVAVRFWNSIFRDCKGGLEYPPRIKAVLIKLRPNARLKLPFFPDSVESEGSAGHRQPSNIADTQDDLHNFFGSNSMGSIMERQSTSHLDPPRPRKSTPQVVIEAGRSLPAQGSRSREQTPELGKGNSKKRASAQKLRHEDSQIQFEAIESSPLADAVVDSQLLTDRQKDVKERQKADAAMFPDLHSSPRPKGNSSSVELPLHRSASKTSSVAPRNVERQTTPTLVPPAEEDDYVNSSPTPTRWQQLPKVPSSSPETTAQPLADFEDDMDIPSSPPEIIEDQGNDNAASLDPSAQIDPYAPKNSRTLSTLDGDLDGQDYLRISDPSALATLSRAENNAEPSTSDVRPDQSSLAHGSSQIEVPAMESHSTPTSERGDIPIAQQIPRSPIFHDALTSPASSEKSATGEEVFQDAFSSPRLNLKSAKTMQISSPLSDFDESSMLRLAKEFDQGSGRPKRNVKFSFDKENQPEKQLLLKDSPCPRTSADVIVMLDTSTGDVSEVSAMHLDGADESIRRPNLRSGKGLQSSSLPSLIPETPGTKATVRIQVVDGEEINPDETIVVETPEDYEAYRGPRRKRTKGSFNRVRDLAGSPTSKKRKHEDVSDGGNEVPDSQDIKVEGRVSDASKFSYANAVAEPSPKKRSPARKRRGWPPKRASRGPSQTGTNESEAAQSFSSMDLDTSMQDTEEMDSTTDAFTSSGKEAMEDHDVAISHAIGEQEQGGGPNGGGKEVELAETAEEGRGDVNSSREGLKDSDVEVIAETTIDESSLIGSSADALREAATHEETGVTNVVEHIAISSGEPSQICHPPQDASSRNGSVEEVISAQGMRDKLQSLISDLDTASLTREEVNRFEDMFMDAKEKLYGAARRGRAGS
jgi:hypothetical protein